MCAGSVQRLLAESIVALVKTPGSICVSSSSVRDGESLCFWRGRHFGEGQGPLILLSFTITKGNVGDNRFGPDPKAEAIVNANALASQMGYLAPPFPPEK